MKSFYVDNAMIGAESIDEAKQLYKESKRYFNQISMNLREFGSNNKEFMNFIPKCDRVQKSIIKVLGMPWDLEKDIIGFQMPKIE